MIKNLIFDLAGVLFDLSVEKDTSALASVGLPTYEECLQIPPLLKCLNEYLNGLTDEPTFLAAIRPYCRPDATDQEILASMDAVLDDIPVERLQRLVELRKKYKVILVSNLYDTAWRITVRTFQEKGYPLEECFDHTFFSQHLRLAKPDPRIYQHVFKVTGIDPSETLYFDDSRDNIQGGNAVGLHSVLVPMNHLEEVPEYQNL